MKWTGVNCHWWIINIIYHHNAPCVDHHNHHISSYITKQNHTSSMFFWHPFWIPRTHTRQPSIRVHESKKSKSKSKLPLACGRGAGRLGWIRLQLENLSAWKLKQRVIGREVVGHLDARQGGLTWFHSSKPHQKPEHCYDSMSATPLVVLLGDLHIDRLQGIWAHCGPDVTPGLATFSLQRGRHQAIVNRNLLATGKQ